MTETEPIEDLETWLEHPLVQQATQCAGGVGDPLLLLEMLYETMNDLEERFPGMSFEQMLTPARRYDKGRMRKALIGEGYSDEQACDILNIRCL